MRNLFLLLTLCATLLFTCSDGDVFDVEFDFDDTFQACEESNLLFFKIKEDPSETLSVEISGLTLSEIFEGDRDSINIPGEFIYRTYNRPELPNNLFCNIVPPANLNITINEESPCTSIIRRTLEEDDNDGIPSELESTNGIDPLGDEDNDGVLNYLDDNSNDITIGDENGLIEDGFDTDGDGLPNFIDADDDGDNVLTRDENPDPNGDRDFSDAQNTDGEDNPDYLDTDDDNDGVLTRDEENDTQDQNPVNDITNTDVGPDFLNPNVDTSVEATAYRVHEIDQVFNISLFVEGISINFLLQDELDFGFLTGQSALTNTREVTPSFP